MAGKIRAILLIFTLAVCSALGKHLKHVAGLTIHEVPCDHEHKNCRCDENAEVCEFQLVIEKRNTFIRYAVDEEFNELGERGTMYYFDNAGNLVPHPFADSFCIGDPNCTEAVTADASTNRPYIAINGHFPGPNLIVHYNQTLSVNVVNRLEQETTSVHWHGIHQKGTPWMDGVEQITQCGIPPGASFRYIFKAVPSGTFWYHSHTGAQRTEGMFGGLIILETNQRQIKEALGEFHDEPENHTLSILEWFPTNTLEYVPRVLTSNRFFQPTPPGPNDFSSFGIIAPDGSQNGNLFLYSGLINGKGKRRNTDEYPYIKSRLSVFSVDPGEVYRFRLIGAQGFFLFRFSIDEHELEVIATDGYLTQPVTADYIAFHSGERFDFLLRAKNSSQLTKNDFWIRAEVWAIFSGAYPFGPLPGLPPYRVLTELSAEAILHYNAPGLEPPTSSQYEAIKAASIPKSTECTSSLPCQVVNCPFMIHRNYNISCVFTDQLRLLFPAPDDELPQNAPEPDGLELFFNFATDGVGLHNSVNGRRMRFPSVPLQLLTDPDEREAFFTHKGCKNVHDREVCRNAFNSIILPECHCSHVANVPAFGTTTRFVMSSLGPQADTLHPIHLHGHSFFVLEIGFPDYNSTTGLKACHNDSLDCFIPAGVDRCRYVGLPPAQRHYSCNNPEWRPGMKPVFGNASSKIDPYTIRKDTVTIPGGGYVVIQFLADNPGHWFMHCHMETHTMQGMGVIINEAFGQQISPPPGMRTCGNFSWDLEQFYNKILNPGPEKVTNVTVGVTRQAVSVLEGELLQFCLQILEGVVQEEALVIAASTFNGTAFAGNDYVPVSTNLVFVPGSGVGAEVCTFTQVMSDSVLESAEESFSIKAYPSEGQSHLVISADQQVTLVTIVDTNTDQQVTLVTIVDTNVVAVGFQRQSYTVSEGTPALDVCVLLSGAVFRTTALARPVRVRVTSQGDTATAGEDYLEVTPQIVQFPISFERAEGRWCVTLQIIDDLDYEGELPESFVISLSVSDAAVIMNQASTTVSILDDEEPSRNLSAPLKVYFSGNTPLVNGLSITVQVFTNKPATAICRLGQTKTMSCPPGSSTTFQDVSSGYYNLRVTATTAVGENAEVSWKVYMPTTSTTCSVNLINAGLVVNGTQITVEFQAVGAATGFRCKVDDGPFDPCVSPHSYNGLSPGDHRLRIVPEGCLSNQGQTYRFTV